MKKLLLVISMTLCVILSPGQTPNKFNYQAIVRNADGTIRSNTSLEMTFIIYDLGTGGEVVHQENQQVTSNQFGLVNVAVGEQVPMDFSWAGGPYQLEVQVDGATMHSAQILAVPYALAAGEVADKDDADADPENELQDLQLEGNILKITGNPDATPITIPLAGEGAWLMNGDSVTITGKNVGIGTTSPGSRLVVMADGAEQDQEPLFEVKKADGQTVFAVFNDGAEVYVNNDQPGEKSGFIVKSLNQESGSDDEYLRVTPDSVRIYIYDDPNAKGIKGGFAVGGYKSAKGSVSNFMSLTADNYFIGHESGIKITEGKFNSTMGFRAGAELITGSENIFLGYQSGMNTIGGYQNTFLGYEAGVNNTEGYRNTFIGYRAGNFNTTGYNNIFLGFEAGYWNSSGSRNLFLGDRSGTLNTTGESNTFIGTDAGLMNTEGSYNLFFGPGAGSENVTGERNLFFGNLAGKNNVSGSNNLFIGDFAGYGNVEGHSNIFIGRSSGAGNTTGFNNVFMGDQAGTMNGSGRENLFLGYHTGYNNVTGTNNTIMGFEAGYDNDGSNNVYIGSRAGTNNRGEGNIFIGTGAAGLESFISNMLVIDNTIGIAADNALISGKLDDPRHVKFTARVGIWRTPTLNRFEVEGDASKTTAGEWLANSDMRIKTEIRDIENACQVVMKLHPVQFRYSDEYLEAHPTINDRVYYNFIAQEYREVFPESVSSSGEILESAGDEILQMDAYNAQIYSIKAVQELISENKRQKEQIDELYKMIDELKAKQ